MAEIIADVEPEIALPIVKAFDPGRLLDLFRRSGVAKTVNVAQLFKKQHGIIDVVEAEFQRIYVPCVQVDRSLLSRQEGAVCAYGKIRLGGADGEGKKQAKGKQANDSKEVL